MLINICLASDENYLQYMATTIVSILLTAEKTDKLHFYILCNQIPEKSKNYIKSLKKFKNFDITFLDLNIDEFASFPAGGPHISNTTYFRYKIAELCKDINKIIYLDCDIIVKQSLSELFKTDLTDYYLGGVEDVGYYYWKNYNPNFIYKDGFYINAGMLLINLDEWRKNNLFDKLVNFTMKEADKIKIGDQDVINQVCKGKIKQLDYKWNVQDSFYREEPERAYNPNCKQIIQAAKKPAIIHYTNSKKPWNNSNKSRSVDWIYFEYLRTRKIKDFFRLIYAFIKTHIRKTRRFIFKTQSNHQYKILSLIGIKIKFKRRKNN